MKILRALPAFLALCPLALQAQVVLEMIDPITSLPSVSVAQGGTFQVAFRVSGLQASNPLEAIDFKLDPLIPGVSRISFSDNLPTDWFGGSGASDLTFSLLNLFGSPLSGGWTFSTWTFSVAGSVAPGPVTLAFIPQPSPQQQMLNPSLETIPFTQQNFTFTVVPEPHAVWLIGLAVLTWMGVCGIHRRNASPTKHSRIKPAGECRTGC